MKSEVEVRVPKDIRKYKTKIIGPFTMRQLICLVCAGAVDLLAYGTILSELHLDREITFYALILVDLPILLFMTEPDGMKFEVYLKEVVFKMFFYPRYRKIKNVIVPKKTETQKVRTKKELKKLKKQHPELKAYK